MENKVKIQVLDSAYEVFEVNMMSVDQSLWTNDLEGLWYEYNKRFDDVGNKEGVLDGWKVTRHGDKVVVVEDGLDIVVFSRIGLK